ncbi:hypothetical protein RRG08_063828, partial [Elysia crispata]
PNAGHKHVTWLINNANLTGHMACCHAPLQAELAVEATQAILDISRMF